MEKKLVFISHITEEKELAKILSEEIEKTYLGMLDTFVSSDGESLPAGGRWLDTIDQALNKSAIQISLCSPQSIKRPWINFEAGAAWIRKIPVIPICHSGLKKNDLPIPLCLLQGADIGNQSDLQAVFKRLTQELGATTPNIDYQTIITKSSAFEQEYTFMSAIRASIFRLIKLYPDLSELFLSRKIINQQIEVKDFLYIDFVKDLEFLKNNNCITYNFMGDMRNFEGAFKMGSIALTNNYFDNIYPLLEK